jgi:6-phosphogluconolactonase
MKLRVLLAAVVAGTACAAVAGHTQPADRLVFVGTYTGASSRGIHAFRFNSVSGQLTALGLAAETPNPSFLAASPDGRFVFAVNELGTYQGEPSGSVTSFAVDRRTGRLSPINTQSTRGGAPCHLAIDRTGRFLAVANYGGGNFVILPIAPDGSLGPVAANVRHDGSGPNNERQRGPHAHMVEFDADNTHLLGADLGIDRIVVYPFDEKSGRIADRPSGAASTSSGAGPRHITFHPTEALLFAINELNSTIETFTWDAASGHLDAQGGYSTLPDGYTGESFAAEIAVHPNGRFLYGSNRGHDTIAVFGISSDGQLALVEHAPTRGRTPRAFTIDPTGRWLIAANQQSDTLAAFTIDDATGRLSPHGELETVGAPVSILFLP